MNFLIAIFSFILGWILGIYTRNILMKIINVKKKIKMAERIIAEEEKRREFKEKHDFSDCFKEEEK
ncbi:MAG: hypothetical protein E7310_06845 [Clostridiales bacterium]|nr:hypothetical protein [Clostridiales bacterium]